MNSSSRIFVAGGDTLIGAAILDRLREEGCHNLVGVANEPDLGAADEVADFFAETRPEVVFVAAGLSGGIGLNVARPADLLLDNLRVATNLIPLSHTMKVRKLLYFASSCSYPRLASQPMAVDALGTGALEPTNAAYATAKLAGMQLCAAYREQYGADFRVAIPANVFGPRDTFRADAGHVIPALIRRLDEAKRQRQAEVSIWGSGSPRREFLYAKDLADAALFVMRLDPCPAPINLGGGTDVSIAELAALIARVVGYRGRLAFDATKPDGMPLKRLDASPLLGLGWRPAYGLTAALAETYTWYLQHVVKEDPDNAPAPVPVALSHSSR